MIDKNIFELELTECINAVFNMRLEDAVQHFSEMIPSYLQQSNLQQSKIEQLANSFLYTCVMIHTSKETSDTYKEALKTAEFIYKNIRKYQWLDLKI